MKPPAKSNKAFLEEIEDLRRELYEATETIEAIRTGQVDALVVQQGDMQQLYTLQTADHAYRIFVEKMTEGAVTLNSEGIILYCNSAFANMVGLELTDVTGALFENLLDPQFRSSFRILFEKCHRGDCKGEAMLEARGLNIPVQLSFAVLEQNEDTLISVIVTDLAMQKRVQEQLLNNNYSLETMNRALEISNRDLLQFASVASHDLQEPVRKIQIFSALLKENDNNNISEESKLYLQKIISSAARMKMLIVDMLNYSQLSSNAEQFEPTDMNEVMKDVTEDLELVITEKKASVKTGALPVIEANRGRMQQVFQNLVSNALKFSKKNTSPVISISAKRISELSFHAPEQADGEFYLFSVKDNGIGFDDQYAGNIFNLFERLNSKDAYEGTGIGLAITKKIIEKHRGMIMARSEQNSGAEFLITLPVKQ